MRSGLLPVWCEELGRLLMLRHDPSKSRPPLPNHVAATINSPAMTSGPAAAAAAAAATG